MPVPIAPYPRGLTAESAFCACDGPVEQQITELRRIITACTSHGTPEAIELKAEAEAFLERHGVVS